jgi:hypothetical protein
MRIPRKNSRIAPQNHAFTHRDDTLSPSGERDRVRGPH